MSLRGLQQAVTRSNALLPQAHMEFPTRVLSHVLLNYLDLTLIVGVTIASPPPNPKLNSPSQVLAMQRLQSCSIGIVIN